jgi:hypothetical protein
MRFPRLKMYKSRPKSRYSISLGALMTAWGILVMWLCWTEVVGGVLDDFRQHQQDQRTAMSQPLVRP